MLLAIWRCSVTEMKGCVCEAWKFGEGVANLAVGAVYFRAGFRSWWEERARVGGWVQGSESELEGNTDQRQSQCEVTPRNTNTHHFRCQFLGSCVAKVASFVSPKSLCYD